MHAAWAQHGMFVIIHTYKHVCTHKIDDIKLIIQSSHVRTKRVHNSLQIHVGKL